VEGSISLGERLPFYGAEEVTTLLPLQMHSLKYLEEVLLMTLCIILWGRGAVYSLENANPSSLCFRGILWKVCLLEAVPLFVL